MTRENVFQRQLLLVFVTYIFIQVGRVLYWK